MTDEQKSRIWIASYKNNSSGKPKNLDAIYNKVEIWNEEQGKDIWTTNRASDEWPSFNKNIVKQAIISEETATEYTILVRIYDENLLSPNPTSLKDKIVVKVGNNIVNIQAVTINSMETDEYILASVKTEPITEDLGGTFIVGVKEQAIYDKANNTNTNIENILNEKIQITANPKIEITKTVIGQTTLLKVTNVEQFVEETVNWQWYYKDGEEEIKIDGATTYEYELSAQKAYELEGKEIYCVATMGEKQNKSQTKSLTIDYTISTAKELEGFRDFVNSGTGLEGKTVYLGNDIDLNGSETNQWIPLGNLNIPFKGTFDGQGYKISGICINNPNENYQGLFGYIENATISNLAVDGNITGKGSVGGISGAIGTSAIIENCYNAGTVTGNGRVGGISGSAGTSATIQNCYNTGAVTGNSSSVGGISGDNLSVTIENCYNIGAVTGDTFVGGISGNHSGTIQKCFNTGEISGNRSIGGISNGGTIQNCYNTGLVRGTANNVGGIVGQNTYGGTIQNCYNIGEITGAANNIGGIAGRYFSTSINNCYYNSETSNKTDTYATPKTTAEMTLPEFVLALGIDNWKEDHTYNEKQQINNGYPILKWQEGEETVVIQNTDTKENIITVKITSTDANYKYYEYYITKEGEERADKARYSGQTTEYTFANLDAGQNYIVEVFGYTDNNYSKENSIYGANKIQTVTYIPAVNIQSPKVGYTATFSITNTEELPEDMTMQWYRNANNSTEGGTQITNAKSKTYIESAAKVVEFDNYYYYAGITVNGKEFYSIPIKLQVDYTIQTKAHLKAVATLINAKTLVENVAGLKGKTLYLGNDINLNPGFTFNEDGTYEIDSTVTSKSTPETWTRIGTDDNPFNGSFNGNNFMIKGLYKDYSNNYTYMALFKETSSSAVIENLSIDGYIKINSNTVRYLAGFVAKNYGTIKNCKNYVVVDGVRTVGGIVGDNSGTIINCFNYATINGRYFYKYSSGSMSSMDVGGITGDNSGEIINCHNMGNVVVIHNNKYLSENFGGICGINSGIIKQSSNIGEVKGHYNTGGICGENFGGTVQECFNKGSIKFAWSQQRFALGGIAGYNSGDILNCYNKDELAGGMGIIGGICGPNEGIVQNCYNASEIYSNLGTIAPVSINESYGGETINCFYLDNRLNDGNATELIEAEMKTQEFVDLLNTEDTEIWKLDNNNINDGYPILSWQED